MPALEDYRLQIVPSPTNADQYEIGQLSSDLSQKVAYKDGSQKHQWVPSSGAGAASTTPPPINDATSTDPLAYASANQIRVLEQALVKTGSLSPTGILTLTDRSGLALAPPIDLSSLAADKFLVSGSYVAATKTLDLVMSAGPVISIPVSALLAVTHDATLSGDGATTPLRVELSADAGNLLILGTDGKLKVTIPVTTHTLTASASAITSTVNGVAATITLAAGTVAQTLGFDAAGTLVKTAVVAPTPTTVSNTIAGAGATRTLTTTVNGVTSTPQPIPDTNDNVLAIGGTAAAPTISNGGAAVAIPSVPPTSNTLAITKAGGAVSTVQGVAGTQLIPSGTIVETLGYNAAGVPVYQVLPAATLDGNDRHVIRANSSNAVAPSATEVPSPVAGDTAKVQLANKSVEFWSYNGTSWTLDFTQPGLDGNDKHVLRANATASVAPTATEVPTPISGDTAKISLTDGSIEYWTFSTVWAKDFTSVSAPPNVTFGTVAPIVTPTNKKGDEYYITTTGTSAGAIQSRWIYDGTAWVNTATTVPDDIVDVTGATLPITFPVATLPGTPVFAPATPTSTTAIYAIASPTGIQYAKWNGTQYISAPAPLTPNVRYGATAPVVIAGTDKKNDTYVQTSDGTAVGTVIAEWVFDGTIWKNVTAPSQDFFRSGTGTTLPDGTTDPTENISRAGKTGFGITDPSTVKFIYELDGTTGIRQDVLANATATCTIPATATNLKSSIVVTQTVADAVLLFAAPNVAAMAGQVFTVINSDLSTNKISYLGYDIHPNQSLTFTHTGRMWQIEEVGINSDVQLETAVTVLPTSTTALASFAVVPGGIQSSTTTWVEVPGTSFVATGGGEYLVKYVAYASCSGGIPVPAVGNGFRIAVGSNLATGSVQTTVPATGRVIDTSQTLITNIAANQIDPYTKSVIVRAKPGETIQLQMNSVIGSQIVYQSATQNSRLEYAKIVNSTPIAYAATTQLAGSATPYTYLPLDNNLIISGGAGVVQNITFPSASAFPGREISLQMPEVNNYETNLISGGGNIEMPDYFLTGSGRLSSGAVASLTWQSDGIAWRLMSYSERKFYSTTGYTIPPGGNFITFLGAGGAAPAAGVAFQVPANATSWLVLNANYTPLIALPIAPTPSGRFSVYPDNSPGFDTIISTTNTNLPRNTTVPSGQGRSMHFEWSDGKWRWVPSPEPASAGVRVNRRGTFAAPLTGAIAVAIDDHTLVVGNASITTLPSPAAPNIDRLLRIKKPGTSTAQLIGSIDGIANLTLSGVSESLDLQSDGTTWMRI